MRKITLLWFAYEEKKPPFLTPIFCWHPDWVDEDFNPTGIREGYRLEDLGFISFKWDACADGLTAHVQYPREWCLKER